MEFSSLNGYKIKDKKAIRFYDTVYDMKNDSTLKEGMHVKTKGYYIVNDGGLAEYHITDIQSETEYQEELENGLYANLILDDVNLIKFGCYGDGVHDDTENFKKALNFAYSNDLCVTSNDNKIYLLSELITLPNINLRLSNATIKTDYGLKISATLKELNFPRIESISNLNQNTGIELFECYTNKIYIPYIYGYTVGLLLNTATKGCCYNNITIQEIRNCLSSIKLLAGGTGWVNENLFIGGRLWNDSTFITSNGADIKIIYIQGSETHKSNNNHFISQCVEGTEGSSGGVKVKLDYAQNCYFDDLRYEGSDAKIDVTNSLRNVFNNGFNLNAVSFINDMPTVYVNGVNNKITNGGGNGGVYLDVQMNSNSYPSLLTRRTDGTIANKITPTGIFTCGTDGNEVHRFNTGGIDVKYNDTFYRIIGGYHQYTLIPNCDGTNRCFVIGSGTNVNNAVFLWYNDGHLYGKIGEPSSASDGTIIL